MPCNVLKNCAIKEMISLAHDAWLCGLFSAQNGNISQKLPAPFDTILVITASGSCKGHLKKDDFCVLDMTSGLLQEGSRVSSETKVHLALYAACQCQAVVHCHPPKLLAWEIIAKGRSMLDLPIFEARFWKGRMTRVGAYPPGSEELATAVEKAAADFVAENPERAFNGALWMAEHGLCTWGRTFQEALAISEEMEHLAEIALLARTA